MCNRLWKIRITFTRLLTLIGSFMFQPIVISSVCFDSRSLSFHCVISHSLYIQSNHYITRNEDNILLPKYWRENVKQALYWIKIMHSMHNVILLMFTMAIVVYAGIISPDVLKPFYEVFYLFHDTMFNQRTIRSV